MNNKLKTIYCDLLNTLAQANGSWRNEDLTGFAPLRGNKFDNGLLVVGRAVNGWARPWRVDDLIEAEKRDQIIEELYPSSVTQDCPMAWISESWGDTTKGVYNTAKSAFWRVNRGVVRGLAKKDFDDSDWPSTIAWSNLYRVSPYKGGNPSDALVNAQRGDCIRLLQEEIELLRPSKIMFLTGWGWAQWFLSDMGIVANNEPGSIIESSGNINSAKVIVLPHPQGKSEEPIITEAVKYFSSHGD